MEQPKSEVVDNIELENAIKVLRDPNAGLDDKKKATVPYIRDIIENKEGMLFYSKPFTLLFDKDTKRYTFSVCSRKDQFCKKYGRFLASINMIYNHSFIIPSSSEIITDEIFEYLPAYMKEDPDFDWTDLERKVKYAIRKLDI